VSLEPAPGGFKLLIADNGSGFDAQKPAATGGRVVSGYGLSGIRRRLDQIGGRVDIRSEAGVGVQVELFVPQADFPQSMSASREVRT
jgi:signal transduction histidine kinase